MNYCNISIDPRVFNKAYRPFINCDIHTQIFFGGGSSGKSVFLAQRDITDILKGGRNFLILRNTGNTLRDSVFNEMVQVINGWNLERLFSINRSDLTITCKNGYQILFKGLDDVEKIKSIRPQKEVITDIRIEEATETKRDDIKQLNKRLRGKTKSNKKKRMTFSFNPIMRSHWIYKEYFEGNFHDGDRIYKDDHLLILKTTYKDNAFLTEEDVYELENETDKYYYEVYTLGNWGVLGNVIFTNWRIEDLSEIRDQFGTYKSGLDFGFTNDPTAFVRFAKKEKRLYITHGFYEYGLTNNLIAERILKEAPALHLKTGHELVRCDSSEPKSIFELRKYEVNAISAFKGSDSVNYGIQNLKQYDEIIIDRPLQPVINEFQLYQWQKNKDGQVLNIPVDKNNHAIDALRYGESDVLLERQSKKSGSLAKNLY